MKKCVICKGKKIRLKFHHKGFAILECKSCHMVFVDPDSVDKNYQKQYVENVSSPLDYYKAIESYDEKSFKERLNLLNKYFPKSRSLLEIGSNTGTFLKTAKNIGWNVTGIEPNKLICKEFMKKNKNIKIYKNFFDKEFIKKHKKKYDLIYSSDVIEHVHNPVEFMSLTKKLLKKDGLVVTITPDFDNILSKLFQIKPTEHLIYLNKKNIKELYKRAKQNIIEVKNIHRYRNLNGMLYSTTFTDKNNRGNLYGLVKLINLFKIKKFVEFILDFFKEDIFVVSR
jgi:2-polyprenyl-3-methyl-5-hydroxy-6-metoxy-1,4-benzoquinol methylase